MFLLALTFASFVAGKKAHVSKAPPTHVAHASPSNWMMNIPDDYSLTKVSIPGTHDSGALNCQVPSVKAIASILETTITGSAKKNMTDFTSDVLAKMMGGTVEGMGINDLAKHAFCSAHKDKITTTRRRWEGLAAKHMAAKLELEKLTRQYKRLDRPRRRWGQLNQWIKNAEHWAKHAWKAGTHWVAKKAGTVEHDVVHAADTVGHWVEKTAKTVVNDVVSDADKVGHWVDKEAKNVEHDVVQDADKVGNWVEKAASFVGKKVVNDADKVGNWVKKAATDVEHGVVTAADKVGSWVSEEAAKVPGALEKAGKWVDKEVDKVPGDLDDAAKWVDKEAKGAVSDVDKAANWVKKKLHSKVIDEAADLVEKGAQDVDTGVDKASDFVKKEAKKAVKTIKGDVVPDVTTWVDKEAKNVKADAGKAKAWVKKAAKTVENTVDKADDNVRKWVKKAAKKVKEGVDDAATKTKHWVKKEAKVVAKDAAKVDRWMHKGAKKFKKDADKAGRWMKKAGKYAEKHFKQDAAKVGNWVKKASKVVKNAVVKDSDIVGHWMEKAATDVKNTVVKDSKKVGRWIKKEGKKLPGLIHDAAKWVKKTADAVEKGVEKDADKVGHWVKDEAEKVPGVIDEAAKWVKGVVHNGVVDEAVDWVEKGAKVVDTAVVDAIPEATKWVKKEAKTIGKDVDRFIPKAAKWVTKEAKKVVNDEVAATALVGSLAKQGTKQFNGAVGLANQWVEEAANAVDNSEGEIQSQVDPWAKNTISKKALAENVEAAKKLVHKIGSEKTSAANDLKKAAMKLLKVTRKKVDTFWKLAKKAGLKHGDDIRAIGKKVLQFAESKLTHPEMAPMICEFMKVIDDVTVDMAETQVWTIYEQALLGVRMFDLRFNAEGVVSNGPTECLQRKGKGKLSWEIVAAMMSWFLQQHPSECLIARIELTGDVRSGLTMAYFWSMIYKKATAVKLNLLFQSEVPTIGECRGQLWVITSSRMVASHMGAFYTGNLGTKSYPKGKYFQDQHAIAHISAKQKLVKAFHKKQVQKYFGEYLTMNWLNIDTAIGKLPPNHIDWIQLLGKWGYDSYETDFLPKISGPKINAVVPKMEKAGRHFGIVCMDNPSLNAIQMIYTSQTMPTEKEQKEWNAIVGRPADFNTERFDK